ncbi:MAG: hypothetical protein U5K28_12745 [Halobacteriales archaeon]|nr:hypothetical protein [Halobacteriales archaeon]
MTFEVSDSASTGDVQVDVEAFIDGSSSTATGSTSVTVEDDSSTTPTPTPDPEQPDSDLTADNNNAAFNTVFYQGQEIVIDGFEDGELVNLRQGNSEESTQVDQFIATDGTITVDTADLEQADHFVVGQQSGNQAGFEISVQNLDVTLDQTTVANDGSNALSELSLETNRAGELTYEVTAGNLSDDELLDIFQNADSVTDADVDGDSEDDNDGIAFAASDEAALRSRLH